MSKLIGDALPNLPWQDKPQNCGDPIWRYDRNPIIPRDGASHSNSIFNSAVVPWKDGFVGIFRCDSKARAMDLFVGKSPDGLHWKFAEKPICFLGDTDVTVKEYRYDPRVTRIGSRYYITWCNGYHGPTIGVGWTDDFLTFHQLENAFLPYNRNGVLFPRKIGGNYAMLSRPSDTGHTPFGDIFYSESPDLNFWGRHRFVMAPIAGNESAWQSTKIGPGSTPIETDEGWLIFYHGVLHSCNGFVYSFGAALLDPEQPWKVIRRSKPYLLSPQTVYECVGDVPNVVFPCAALTDAPTGRIAIYYGCADTVTGICFTTLQETLDFLWHNAL